MATVATTTFTEIPKTVFQLQQTICWGVEPDKYNPDRYKIPVVLSDRERCKLQKLAHEHGANNSRLYGDTLYLTCKALSEKQTQDLLFQGMQHVMVHFEVSFIANTDKGKFLVFRVTKLRRVETPEKKDCPDD